MIRTLSGHGAPINACCFSPNGALIVSAAGGNGYKDETVKLWDAASGALKCTFSGHADKARPDVSARGLGTGRTAGQPNS